MGNVSSSVDRHIAPDRAFSCSVSSDICICAGVSNWAGYALAALLSKIRDENLMAHEEIFNEMLEAVVEKGAVDGVSGIKETTVDGLDRAWEMKIYKEMLKTASVKDYIPGVPV